jgi:hypothetical protein
MKILSNTQKNCRSQKLEGNHIMSRFFHDQYSNFLLNPIVRYFFCKFKIETVITFKLLGSISHCDLFGKIFTRQFLLVKLILIKVTSVYGCLNLKLGIQIRSQSSKNLILFDIFLGLEPNDLLPDGFIIFIIFFI